MSAPSVGQRVVSSAGWSIAGDVVVVLASAASTVVAARLLPKAEIGLVATIALVIAFLETVTASGVEQALVARAKESDALYDSAWTWQLARGALIGALVFAGSPLLAAFYGTPALGELSLVLALQPVIRGASNMRFVSKLRELEFKSVFVLNVVPAVLGLLVTVLACWRFRNAWALVAGTLTELALRTALSFLLMPRRPALRINWSEVGSLLRYGRWMTGLSILVYFTTRGDDLFVSKRFGAADLAVYQLAFGLANVPVTGISRVLGRVAFPAFARLREDPERLRVAFTEIFQVTALTALFISVALYFALPFLPIVVGPQWLEAVLIGQILVAGGAVRALMNTGGPLFQGTGRPDLDFRMNAPRLLVLIVLLVPLSSAYGLIGVSLASLASVCALVPLWWLGVRSQAGVSSRQLGRALVVPLAASLITAVVLGVLSALLPRSSTGMLVFFALGLGTTYGAFIAVERVIGVRLLPSLARLRAL